jgi:hypothetical protein
MNGVVVLEDKGESELVATVQLSGASADNSVELSCFRFFMFGVSSRTVMGGMSDVPCGVRGTSLVL